MTPPVDIVPPTPPVELAVPPAALEVVPADPPEFPPPFEEALPPSPHEAKNMERARIAPGARIRLTRGVASRKAPRRKAREVREAPSGGARGA